MATIEELRKIRLKKLEAIKRAGFSVYPEKTKRTHPISQALRLFKSLAKSEKEIILAGRIRAKREHGGSTFLQIEDGSGVIQAYFRKDRLGPKHYKFFLENFDIGDFIEVRGILFTTKKGEKTIEAADFKILAKAILPLPEKWHGLKDVEERFRKRYLDLIFNPEVKKKFETRSKIIREIRAFMEKNGFLEVETPILQPVYGGASARPFKTHHNALNIDLYLRIAPELYLKRLLVGGFEKVYEIGRVFRNEGIDRQHNPDYTHFEFYWAYATYKDLMRLTEEMFDWLLKKIFGKKEIVYQGQKIKFRPPWQRVEFNQIIKKYSKIDLEKFNAEGLKREMRKLGLEVPKGAQKAALADEIFKKLCRPNIIQPTFVIHAPVGLQPLAKSLEKNPKKLANFQVIIAGWEMINAFSELNDPLEQEKRFKEQEKIFKEGFDEAQRMDKDFIEALEYGMPPAAGFGMGIDRLAALLTDSYSLRDIILFPAMRPKEK